MPTSRRTATSRWISSTRCAAHAGSLAAFEAFEEVGAARAFASGEAPPAGETTQAWYAASMISPMTPSVEARRARFRELHREGCFVIPNPWDRGSAVILEGLGFQALATSSAGFAFSRGKPDTL